MHGIWRTSTAVIAVAGLLTTAVVAETGGAGAGAQPAAACGRGTASGGDRVAESHDAGGLRHLFRGVGRAIGRSVGRGAGRPTGREGGRGVGRAIGDDTSHTTTRMIVHKAGGTVEPFAEVIGMDLRHGMPCRCWQ